MERFVADTGVEGDAPPRRYLWTDAFAVCNLLGLHRSTGEARWLELALRLVDQVHHVLARHRPDDPRTGWISGLAEPEGEEHPTRGGLRIGKELPERAPGERFDPRLEWERDGQYFHYLAQWMHALPRVAEETGRARFHRWAIELAAAAHAGFAHGPPGGGPPRMAWKMSVELDRPLVPSMGHHDPLEALINYLDLATGAAEGTEADAARAELEPAIADAEAMCAGRSWATDDPLGIGGLLIATHRLAGLIARRGLDREPLLRRLLDDGVASLAAFAPSFEHDAPARHRLAFRELGLAIGLHATERTEAVLDGRPDLAQHLAALRRHHPLAARIESFWATPEHRRAPTWTGHADINAVMLATSLAPDGYLGSAAG